MRVCRIQHRWEEVAARARHIAIFDGTAIGHCDYAAIPAHMSFQLRRYDRDEPYNARMTFGDRSIGKGLGDAKVATQVEYATSCRSSMRRPVCTTSSSRLTRGMF